jgi:hypothetical protein
MWSPSRIRPAPRRAGATATLMILLTGLGAILAGCSDMYFDRRETVSLGADDHIGNNRVAQMIDPWPQYVGKRNIAFNGQKMQSAVERYRTNKVTPPVDTSVSSVGYQPTNAPAAATSSDTSTSLSTPAAAVK